MDKLIWKRRQVDRTLIDDRHENIKKKKSWMYILYAFLIIIFISIFVLIWIYRDNWIISDVEYVGVENLSEFELNQILDEFVGKSVFSVNPAEVEQRLTSEYLDISGVRVEKIFPNKLKVSIQEKTPVLIYTNFNGKYLIADNGEVIHADFAVDAINFEDFEYEVARGFGNTEADYVEDRIVADTPDNEIDDFDYELVDPRLKREVLDILEIEKREKFNRTLDVVESDFLDSLDYPSVFGWDEEIFELSQKIDIDQIGFFTKVIEKTEQNTIIQAERYLWDGDLRFIIETFDKTQIIFAQEIDNERNVDIQVQDLFTVLNQPNFIISDYEVIDISTSKILVRPQQTYLTTDSGSELN